MFGRGKKITNAKINTLIGRDTVVHGDIRFSGGLHVEGRVEGNVGVESEEQKKAVLILSENGVIEGEVWVPNMILNGTVEGDVHATERLELATKARVKGNVYYNLLEMAVGAEVNGNLVHQTSGALQLEFKGGASETGSHKTGGHKQDSKAEVLSS
ncbi:MAG: bactofilin family protein [Gammaproteobacteria bacterium]